MKIALTMIFIFAAFFPSTGAHDFRTCFYGNSNFHTGNETCIKCVHSKYYKKPFAYKNNITHCDLAKTKNINNYISPYYLRHFVKSLLR